MWDRLGGGSEAIQAVPCVPGAVEDPEGQQAGEGQAWSHPPNFALQARTWVLSVSEEPCICINSLSFANNAKMNIEIVFKTAGSRNGQRVRQAER